MNCPDCGSPKTADLGDGSHECLDCATLFDENGEVIGA
jgi:transcription initiation factor TFIIIB Brf1 subunit/transcription initiation factor TFIIB